MWRRSNLTGNPDSDQSISEEEEEHVNASLGENDMCPSEKAKEEGGLLLQTKLEKLIGCSELNYARETGDVSLEATLWKVSSSLEDDVEVPDSPEESYFASSRRTGLTCKSVQENVSDDEIPLDEPVATWSTISKETKSLIHLNGIASVSSSHSSGFRTNRGSKVLKDHVRPKFSFHSHTHGETLSKISDLAENFEPADDQAIEEDPIAECLNDFDEISENRQDISVADSREVLHGCTEDMVSKLLVPPPDKIRVIKRSSKPYSRREGKSLKFAHKEDSDTDDELPGPMDSESSSDDEPSYQSSVPNISNQKKQFVGDRFDEAVKASSLSKEGLLFGSPKLSGGSSLYEKLQQIMKQEKETETEITKKLQGGIGEADASNYVDIKIMSRHLEGKLVVCKCSVIDLSGDSLLLKNTQALAAKETETTIIFNPKVCADVDIEIGSFVRIYAPWKEMEVKNTSEFIICIIGTIHLLIDKKGGTLYVDVRLSVSYTSRLSMDCMKMMFKLMPDWKRAAEVKKLGYKVHGDPFSTNTRRVLAVLLEKGLSYEPITVDLQTGEHKRESFLSLNPFGQVPVFEDRNLKLCESRAITQYIAYVHSSRGTQLLNLRSHETMATLTMWMEIEAHQFDPPASKLTWEQVIKPLYGLETDQTVVKENEANLEKVLNVYEKRLGESRFLACGTFTLADLHHLPNLQYLLGTPTKRLFESRPKVRKWVDEITGREAWKMACDQDKSWFGKQRK